MTYYVLFFIHLESRRVEIAGITIHPNEPWMKQMARNVTMEGCGILRDCRYLVSYPHELWTTRLLASHAREHGPAERHDCLANLA
jgi:hypothetical protein